MAALHLFTGRLREILDLRWKHFDCEGALTVRRNCFYVGDR
jgi:hypothetical protein